MAFTKRVVHGADNGLAVEEQIFLIGHWLTVLVNFSDEPKSAIRQLLDNTLLHSEKEKNECVNILLRDATAAKSATLLLF